jgi:molybdopterin-binding protein
MIFHRNLVTARSHSTKYRKVFNARAIRYDRPSFNNGFGPMKISARNQIKGKVVDVTKGQTTSHVRIAVSADVTVTASITNEAVDELALKAGDSVVAIIKASDVMVGK